MRNTPCTAATLFVAFAAAADASAAVLDVPVTPFIVRIYDAPALPAPDDEAALKEAQTILTHAGLAPEWVPCALTAAAPARCAIPLGDAELAVRIVTGPPAPYSPRPLPLGYSLVD